MVLLEPGGPAGEEADHQPRRSATTASAWARPASTGMGFMHGMFDLPLPRFHHIGNPYGWREGWGKDPEEFGREAAGWLEAKILELGPENVAAFVAEPVQGAGGVIIPPASYWPEVQRICREHDVLLVADEVICGFGRTRRLVGLRDAGVRARHGRDGQGPVLGLPADRGRGVGRAGRRRRCSRGEKEFAHGVTYAGHPVCGGGGAREHRDHRGGRPGHPRRRPDRGLFRRSRWRASPTTRSWARCARWA